MIERSTIEAMLGQYRTGLANLIEQRLQTSERLQHLEATIISQKGAIQALEAILTEENDADSAGDGAEDSIPAD